VNISPASHDQGNREDYQDYGKDDEEARKNNDFIRLPLKLFSEHPLDISDADQLLHLLLEHSGTTVGVFGEPNIQGNSGKRKMPAVRASLETVTELLQIPRGGAGKKPLNLLLAGSGIGAVSNLFWCHNLGELSAMSARRTQNLAAAGH
jgi:hypothetical protein